MKSIPLIALTALFATVPAALSAQAVRAPGYVRQAGASDLYERTSSELMLRSRNPEIRRYATMMIRDHRRSTAEVTAAARASGVRPMPPRLMPRQARDIAALRAARGPDRDRLYLEQQRMAHREALELHRTYAQAGDARPLRRVATTVVPVVQHHLEMLRDMR
jgi:putative membrane protein